MIFQTAIFPVTFPQGDIYVEYKMTVNSPSETFKVIVYMPYKKLN